MALVVHQSVVLIWSFAIRPRECFGTIHVSANPSMRLADGAVVVSSIVNGSTTLTPLTVAAPSWNALEPAIGTRVPAFEQPPALGSRQSSMEYFTSSAVKGSPSCQVTPARSLMVHVSPSALVLHDSARSGMS